MGKEIDNCQIRIYFCKNCGTFTLLINNNEKKLLKKYKKGNDLLLTENYDISIQSREYKEYLSRCQSDKFEKYMKYWNLLNSGAIDLSYNQKFSYYPVKYNNESKDIKTVHVTCEYRLNQDLDFNYLCVSDELLEKIRNVNDLHGEEKEQMMNDIHQFDSKIKCNLCSSENIEPITTYNRIIYYSHTGKYGYSKNENTINRYQEIKEENINYIASNEISQILNEKKNIKELKGTEKERNKYNVQELLLNLINSEKNIKLLTEELHVLLTKREEQKNKLSHYFCKIKKENIKKLEDNLIIPQKPRKPDKPNYKKVGFFSKKADELYNLKLQEEFDKHFKEYENKLMIYNEEFEKYNHKLKKIQNGFINDEFSKLLDFSNANNDFKINSNIIINKQDISVIDEITKIYKELNNEIEITKDNLLKWKEIQEELISLNILFPKYNNLVAWSTMNEYFITGRVTELGGPNGAYNLFENEARANIIITQLDKISNQLDDIKQNQYMLYEVMNEIKTNVEELNSKMNTQLTLSLMTAYNTEKIARYSKLTSELVGINAWINASK